MGVDSATLRTPGILGLAERGYEGAIFDQRGHGDSSGVTSLEYTHELWATDVIRLAHYFSWKRFALFGHSYGGFIALEYAVRWPETLNGLILVSTSAGPVAAVPAKCSTNGHVHDFFKQRWPGFFSGSDKQWTFFEQLRFSVAPYNAAFVKELGRYDMRSKIRRINIPALLIVGNEDHYRTDMEWLERELPNAVLHVLPAVGHFPFVEAQEAFLEIVSTFLRRLDRR